MEIGGTVGVPGIGLDVVMPVMEWVTVRAGFTYMPHVDLRSNFGMSINGLNKKVPADKDKIRRMMSLMEDFTGNPVHKSVDMLFTPNASNLKVLVDFMPFKNNRKWAFTAGFYIGNTTICKASNAESANNTLAAVNLYNSFYVKAITGEPISYQKSDGTMGDFNLDGDFMDKFCRTGMMGMPLGYFPNGDKAIMVPNKNNMAKAKLEACCFRPYIGAGYKTPISTDGRWNLKVDAGMLFMGGTPHVYVDNVYRLPKNTNIDGYFYDIVYYDENYEEHTRTPQTIDLTRDVKGIKGKVGNFVKIAKAFPVLPNISCTITYRL